MIPDSFLQELRDKNDIIEIISKYVTVKRAGRNFVALCPFHSEKTPSFTIFPDTQSYYCFGCGSGGDVITFIRQIENLDYLDATEFLAQNCGLEVPKESGYDAADSRLREKILNMNKIAANYYHNSLNEMPKDSEIWNYIKKRKLADKTLVHFGIGYSPSWDGLIKLLKSKGYSDTDILSAGLARKSQKGNIYDLFKGRLMFPIIDVRGNVIGFGGRVIGEGEPKYLNTSDTATFKKHMNLFALNFAKSHCKEKMVLCEGYLDVIAMHQAGFQNAVATLGTAITPEQARLISRYTKSILISYDSDDAGQKATQKAIKLLNEVSVDVKVLKIEGGKDPDEYIREFGADNFEREMSNGKSYIEYKISALKKKYDITSAEGLASFLKEAASVISEIQSPIEREIYASKTANEYGISKDNFEKEILSILKSKGKKEKGNLVKNNLRDIDKKERKRGDSSKLIKAQEMLCAMISAYPDYYYKVSEMVSVSDFTDELCGKIFEYLGDRITRNEELNYTVMSQSFTPEEMGSFVGMVANMNLFCSGRQEEALEYAKILKKDKNNKIENLNSLSDDDFRRLFEEKKGNE